MGTRIEMVSVFPPAFKRSRRGLLWLSKKAALNCLEEAKMSSGELELLIFAGIYRDDHIGEPSIAALIQKEIGANLNLYPIESRTFSFDLNTGGCGLVNAIEVMDGFIQSGKISSGMIITGDSEPIRGLSEFYNFRSAASALILIKSDRDEGFSSIKSYTYPQYQNSFRSFINWKRKKGHFRKKNLLIIEQSDSYLSECVECSKLSLDSFLEESDIKLSEIDLIICSQSPAGFVQELDKRLDHPGNIVFMGNIERGELHTSGSSYALKKAWDDGSYAKAENILFLTVGAGISNTLALYKKQKGI